MSVTAAALPVDVEGDGGQRLRRGEVLVLSLMKNTAGIFDNDEVFANRVLALMWLCIYR